MFHRINQLSIVNYMFYSSQPETKGQETHMFYIVDKSSITHLEYSCLVN